MTYALDSFADETPSLNLLQVLALDLAASVAIGALAHSAGYGLGAALLAGWIGGAVATLALLAGIFALERIFARSGQGRRARARAVAEWQADARADRLGAHLRIWDADMMAERIEMERQAGLPVRPGWGAGRKGA